MLTVLIAVAALQLPHHADEHAALASLISHMDSVVGELAREGTIERAHVDVDNVSTVLRMTTSEARGFLANTVSRTRYIGVSTHRMLDCHESNRCAASQGTALITFKSIRETGDAVLITAVIARNIIRSGKPMICPETFHYRLQRIEGVYQVVESRPGFRC